MISAGKVIALWALYLAILWGVTWAFGRPDSETIALLGGASVLCGATGFWTYWRGAQNGVAPHGDADARMEPDVSPSSAWIGVSLGLLALSAVFGLWLALIAAVMLLPALFGLVRELRERGP